MKRDPVEVLKDLIRIPSASGGEGRVVFYLTELLTEHGLEPIVSGRNVFALRGTGDGPSLLLNSHIDTVPSTDAWTRDPFGAEEEDGRIYGLGSGDAKSAVVGLLAAFLDADLPDSTRVVFTATCDEETGGEGLEKLLPQLGDFDAAVIGEPTSMNVCTAQKGLLKVRLKFLGQAGHASRPQEGVNAIYKTAREMGKVEQLRFDQRNPMLGHPTVVATLIQGGVRSNVIPPECTVTLDCRTTPEHGNEEILALLKETLDAEVEVLSSRFQPVHTRSGEPIVKAAARGIDGAEVKAFGGVSDLFHVRHRPGIIVGPGCPTQSHQADESIEREAFEGGIVGYRNLIEAYFEERGRTMTPPAGGSW